MPRMSLVTYRKKRDFSRTSEPRGKKERTAASNGQLSFVVQKHDATRLHYDFRLELDGVLKSWAVPKGPSLDPGEKRLAVETEDHPLEYGGFEGVIPDGEYGAGPVVVWDHGRWVPEGDPRKAYDKGHLTFQLVGSKLRGGWHLVRTRGNGKQKSWLLMKRNDETAERGSGSKIVDDEPQSAISGRTIEDVQADPERLWHSNRSDRKGGAVPAEKQPAVKKPVRAKPKIDPPDPSEHRGAKKAAFPEFVEPQLATLVDAAPDGNDWFHEIKLDGYRMQVRFDRGKVKLLTRRGHDWSAKLPTLVQELGQLAIGRALLDGELVVMRDGGISDFQRLQNSLSEGGDRDCMLYVFDCLYLDGYDLRALPLRERKQLLAASLEAAGAEPSGKLRYSEHIVGQGPKFFAQACRLGVEGSVCKRADAPYTSGRTKAWLKAKCTSRQEFVIAGYSEPSGSRAHFGALLLGVMEEGELKYAGRVGTGFSEKSLRELKAKLAPLERDKPAYVNPPRGADARDVHWVEPKLVAEVEFAERTSDGLVRHASFQGLREDKPAKEVRAEIPQSEQEAEKEADVPAKTRKGRTSGGTKRRATDTADAEAGEFGPGAAVPALRSVRLTHPERVLFPEINATKADLALYYAQVAPRMLPHVANRPLMLVRCPDGQGNECFHQKHPTPGMSRVIRRIEIPEKRGTFETMYIEDAEGLVQLVQNGALEIHTWGSRVVDVERADQITFDLDPDENLPWARMIEAAHTIERRLTALDLPCFLKTTGGKGLHIVVPITPGLEWDELKAVCKSFADRLVRAEPTKYLATISKAARKGKILIDYLRNGRGATAACAYSTRARAMAPVAMPIEWKELTADLKPDQFTIREVPKRIATLKDPWRDFGKHRPKLTAAVQRGLAKG
jgi:bifunctional non-homologous end joining protein LigD